MKSLNLIGQTLGRLLVVSRQENNKKGDSAWLCRCECGKEKTVIGYSLKGNVTKSCGCINKEVRSLKSTTHGYTKDGISSEYSAWAGMKARCFNEKTLNFKRYGGRGITVCDRWVNSFENFIEDMGDKPSPKHSVERNDVNGNYEPSNCRWATDTEQARNQRPHEDNKTGVRGISWSKRKEKYIVQIGLNYKLIVIGTTKSLEEAKQMRVDAELKYWGESS